MYDYFKILSCDRSPQRKITEKILLILEEFNKIYFVKCIKGDTRPSILDFDLKLYPQMNVRNMNEILEFKNFIQSKFDDYIKIFLGTLFSTVFGKGQDKIDDNSLFLGYLYATNVLKKIAEIQRYNLPLPKEKEFFYPSVNKSEVDKMLTEASQRKKEKMFVLDGNTKANIGIKPYNPLLDKYLFSYFNSENNKNFLKLNGFIANDGEIIYDPIYRETLGFDKTMNKVFGTTNKFLFGYNRKNPGYSIYNQAKEPLILPPIKQGKRKPSPKKKRSTINEESNESGSGSGSGSGDDSGSGSGDDSGSNSNND